MKTNLKKTFFAAMALCVAAMSAQGADYSKYYDGLPIKINQVKDVTVPDYSVRISDFGGVNDGVTLNTKAFETAIAHLSTKGGGHLIVPEGIWYTGPIVFDHNIDLHLDRGALILFSDNLADYPVIKSDWEGLSTYRAMSPLMARGKKNISITGEGTINGNGQAWRPVKRMKMTDNQWKSLTRKGVTNEKGDIWFPNENVLKVYGSKELQEKVHTGDPQALEAAHDFLRPVLVSFIGCTNVLLQGVTFENSPAWNVHPRGWVDLMVAGVGGRRPW